MVSNDEIRKRLRARRQSKSYKFNTGYLICDSCNGYYELQRDESPNDFVNKCKCGGNLIYSNSIESIKPDNNHKNRITCPNCETENPYYANFCQECGFKFIEETINAVNVIQETEIYENSFNKQVERNLKGKELEKAGNVEEAIKLYEININENFVGNGPYDRLITIYRRNKQYDEEIRVLEKAVEVFEYVVSITGRKDGPPKLKRFKEQLRKARQLQASNKSNNYIKNSIANKKPNDTISLENKLLSFVNYDATKLKTQKRGKAKYQVEGLSLFAEEVAINFYENQGYAAMWSENYYWWHLMTLIFWDEIFTPIEGVFNPFPLYTRMNDMPNDFFKPEFYQRRKNLIDAKILNLKNANLKAVISNSYKVNYGRICRPIEDWDRYTLEELLIPINRMDNNAFWGILERLISNFSDNRRGLPDLIVYNENNLFFSEVKSENDRISDKQQEWHEFLIKKEIKVDLFLINHGKRKTDNLIKSYSGNK